ncbi:MAG: leucine-rich repeat protein [Clostridiales bacterium]|nr:leucine-rich repeat protein [Clostridiales bacterium]
MLLSFRKKILLLFCLLLAGVFISLPITAMAADKGTITVGTAGEDLTWDDLYEAFDKAGVNYYFGDDTYIINIAPGVTGIDRMVFYFLDGVTAINFPASIESIDLTVFWACGRLTAINVASGNPNYSSSDGVLFNKSRTVLLRCPAGRAGSYTVPDGVKEIGYGAFEGCQNLTNITIPKGVISIGDEAFMFCESLTSITIPDSVTVIGWGAFAGCEKLTTFTIPAGVTRIEEYTFDNCEGLTRINIPANLSEIASGAFLGCHNLNSFAVDQDNPEYSSFEGVLFNKDRSILLMCPVGKEGIYNVPAGVVTIADSAFAGCYNLTGITISQSVTGIEDEAFAGCDSLSQINIPAQLTGIGKNVFRGCTSLKSIVVDKDNPSFSSGDGVLFNKDKSVLLAYYGNQTGNTYTVPEGVVRIEEEAFAEAENLKGINMPKSLREIGDNAFSSCAGLTKIDLPEGILEIGEGAFTWCSKLSEINIPKSVAVIGDKPFFGCKRLASIKVDQDNRNYASQDGVLFNKDKTCLITCPPYKRGSLTVPASVTEIVSWAFSDCRRLSGIVLPPLLTAINEYTFSGCRRLSSLILPDKITGIGEGAFEWCPNLRSLTIPVSVTSIDKSAFSFSMGLESINFLSITPPEFVSQSSEDDEDLLFDKDFFPVEELLFAENSLSGEDELIEADEFSDEDEFPDDDYLFDPWYYDFGFFGEGIKIRVPAAGIAAYEELVDLFPAGSEIVVLPDFKDLKPADWFFEDVMYVLDEELFSGTAKDTFSPNTPMTRAMLVTVLYRLADQPRLPGINNPFNDLDPDAYYYQAVLWAAEEELVSGTGAGKFAPNESITRQDLAVILMRYLGYYIEFDIIEFYDYLYDYDLTDSIYFADEKKIADYALDAIQFMNALGIIKGKGEGIIDPLGKASRAEVAAMLHRFIKLV